MEFRNIFVRCLLCSFMVISIAWISPTEDVAYAYTLNTTSYTENVGAEIAPAEETEWRYRVVDGKLQKRLWSITYGKWLTDWTWV